MRREYRRAATRIVRAFAVAAACCAAAETVTVNAPAGTETNVLTFASGEDTLAINTGTTGGIVHLSPYSSHTGGTTLGSGTLVVTKGLEVTVGQTMTVASGATLDISAVTDVTVTDPENLSGSGWNAIATDGGSLAVPADTLYPGGDLRAYKIMFDTGKVHVGPNGLMIIFK